jgi:hypothetical protein
VDNLTLKIYSDFNTGETDFNENENSSLAVMLFPLLIAVYFLFGFTQLSSGETGSYNITGGVDSQNNKYPKLNYLALLAKDEFSRNLKDTIYTDKDLYLEMRIDEQTVYVHYKDGSVKHYPVSSGNKYLNKGVESRPGLFAIFLKEELHLSSQFDDAKMYYYMPYNMGIGFHGLGGTGYYGHLGVRPSSHGCIRMRTIDARELFNQCEIGTLVLSHKGNTARVIAFAPEGFKNERQFTKEEYMNLLAYNLNSIYEGKYFITPPKRFIIDPAIIPRIGLNIGSIEYIPQEQQVPVIITIYDQLPDKVKISEAKLYNNVRELNLEIIGTLNISDEIDGSSNSEIISNPELVKKLVYNPMGILPYFPPDR